MLVKSPQYTTLLRFDFCCAPSPLHGGPQGGTSSLVPDASCGCVTCGGSPKAAEDGGVVTKNGQVIIVHQKIGDCDMMISAKKEWKSGKGCRIYVMIKTGQISTRVLDGSRKLGIGIEIGGSSTNHNFLDSQESQMHSGIVAIYLFDLNPRLRNF